MGDKEGGVQAPKSPGGCRRCLFGKVNSRVRHRVQEELAAIRQHDQTRWNFDFEKEEPLEGRYAWSPVGPAPGTPPPGGEDGTNRAAATCRLVTHSQGGSSIGNPCPGGSGTTGHGYWSSHTGGDMENTCGHIEDSPLMEESQISEPTPLEEATGGFSPVGSSSSSSRLSPGGNQLLQGAGFYPVPPDSPMMPSIVQGPLSFSPSVLTEGGGSMDTESAVLVPVPCHRPAPQSQPAATPPSPQQPQYLQHDPHRHRDLPVHNYLHDDHAGHTIPAHQPPGGHQAGIKHTGAGFTPTAHTLSKATESSSSQPVYMAQHSPPVHPLEASLGGAPGGEGCGPSSSSLLVSPHHVMPPPPGDAAAAAATVAEATKRRQTQVTDFYTQQKMTRLQKPKDDAL